MLLSIALLAPHQAFAAHQVNDKGSGEDYQKPAGERRQPDESVVVVLAGLLRGAHGRALNALNALNGRAPNALNGA